jgi:hypothetical protein
MGVDERHMDIGRMDVVRQTDVKWKSDEFLLDVKRKINEHRPDIE